MNRNNKIRNFKLIISIGLIVLIGIGCGGGSSSSPPASTVKEGKFLDSTVEGIRYCTATQSGITDSQGTFKYKKGESITFFIGTVSLGQEAPAKPVMTPIDLVEGAVDQTDPTVTNICRFLQTLDNDGNADNGITIIKEIRDLSEGISINFNLTEDEFGNDLSIQEVIENLTGLTTTGTKGLVASQEAQDHLRDTL